MTPPRDVRTRQQLSEFLKTRRARLSPADVGLPSGRNRRIGGLRREEVAALSGVGLTWYTWLEQGRDIRVSSAFLEQLARALQLSQAERGHLFVLARHQTPPLDARDAPASDPERLHIMLESIVCPAYARNARFDVLAWNGANTRMFGDFAAVAPARRNVLRLMFTQPSYRRTMVNWVADARSLVAKFRLNFGRAAGAEDFAGLVDELSIASADFRRLWAEHDVSDLGEGVTTFSSARHGVEVFRHHTMMPEALPHLRIVMLIPERGPEERGDHSPAPGKGR